MPARQATEQPPRWLRTHYPRLQPFTDQTRFPVENWRDSVSDLIAHVTDDSFESDVLKSDEPVLVDYWAEWCGPCKMIAPVLDEIASEYAGRVKVAKLNIDDNPNTPPRYGIRGIPTLMLFKGGEVEATKVGAVSKSQLTAFIDSNL
jgi:thioredoxin 1